LHSFHQRVSAHGLLAGILTGIAIAVHNFPEGMAAFLAILSRPQSGIALAVAIAIHNVPEVGRPIAPEYDAVDGLRDDSALAALCHLGRGLGRG